MKEEYRWILREIEFYRMPWSGHDLRSIHIDMSTLGFHSPNSDDCRLFEDETVIFSEIYLKKFLLRQM